MVDSLTIDYNNNNQEIDFLGVSQAAWSNELYEQHGSIYEQVLDLLFTDQGIKASVLRCDIAPEYFPQPKFYDFMAHAEQTQIMLEAKARGDVKFIATAWTPPAWMKSNNDLVHGHLKEEYYAEYAEFLVRYVFWFEEQFGLSIDAISIANEPESTAAVNWPCCHWTGEQMQQFHRDYLKPQWEAYNLTGKVKIILGEPFGWITTGLAATLEDPAVVDYVDVVAAHNYPLPVTGNKFPQEPLELAVKHGKKMWMTEVSTVGENDPSMISGLFYAKEMHTFFTTVNANAYLYWVGAYPGRNDEGLLYVVTEEDGTTVCETTKRFYCFGNYSKFVRPGDVRVSTLPASLEDVYVSAFKKPEIASSLTVVAVNDSEVEKIIKLNVNNSEISRFVSYLTDESHDLELGSEVNIDEISRTFTLTLPPRSVSTYVSN